MKCILVLYKFDLFALNFTFWKTKYNKLGIFTDEEKAESDEEKANEVEHSPEQQEDRTSDHGTF